MFSVVCLRWVVFARFRCGVVLEHGVIWCGGLVAWVDLVRLVQSLTFSERNNQNHRQTNVKPYQPMQQHGRHRSSTIDPNCFLDTLTACRTNTTTKSKNPTNQPQKFVAQTANHNNTTNSLTVQRQRKQTTNQPFTNQPRKRKQTVTRLHWTHSLLFLPPSPLTTDH